jgi:hypothetical protein
LFDSEVLSEMDKSIRLEAEGDAQLDFFVADSLVEDSDGRVFITRDYRVKGGVWRVHKGDADPFPSNPHAHCIGGRYAGLKLHLGNGRLFMGATTTTGQRLNNKAFLSLCSLIAPKFPDMTFPLVVSD